MLLLQALFAQFFLRGAEFGVVLPGAFAAVLGLGSSGAGRQQGGQQHRDDLHGKPLGLARRRGEVFVPFEQRVRADGLPEGEWKITFPITSAMLRCMAEESARSALSAS
ncbi:Uncharacterised protein [Acinetobacter baumannii]|nr:Uncharacterised protein [Acinetobacter baumannii]